MSSKRVGVDIGSTAVRVVQVDGLNEDSLAKVSKCAVIPLAPGAVINGRIKDTKLVGFTLAKALKAAGVSAYGVVVGTSTPEAAIAPIKLPEAVKPGDFSNAVRLQGKPISPRVPLDSSALSLFEVGKDYDLGARFLLAAATDASEVANLAEAVRAAKAAPRAIDLAGAATMRALTRTIPNTSDVVTIVDIGSTKTTVITRQGQFLRSVRTLEIGGDDVTRALMGAADENYAISERRKRSLDLRSLPSSTTSEVAQTSYGVMDSTSVQVTSKELDRLLEALHFSADQLIESIATVIESETVRYPAAPTQGIVLAGGGALLRGLKESISARTGVPTLLGRPWAVFTSQKAAKQVLSQMDEPTAMVELTTAIGMALWGSK